MSRILIVAAGLFLAAGFSGHAQLLTPKRTFTRADTLRGSITPERAWWDVIRYDIQVKPDYQKKWLEGANAIRFRITEPGQLMQIDLQEPMNVRSMSWRGKSLTYTREGNVFHVRFPTLLKAGSLETLIVKFEGSPRLAVRPPWDGGWIFTKDKEGRPWMTVADEGLGASCWFPCKDHLSDEPDSGVSLAITVPDTLVAVGNGRLLSTKSNGDGTATYTWSVLSPINSYDIIPYIGKYVNFHEQYTGLKGKLDCNYWVLDYDLDKAKPQFRQVDTMLHAFEYWYGPYPFYEDGYKLVDAPHLGMEHQSNVAYGNHFGNGYLGRDLSGTGWGLKWDYIIVHESGHEWFGNNITDKDAADMWVHEGFTYYCETLYTTYLYGTEAGNDYCIGSRNNIRNDGPIIGVYGVNKEGSGDMYYKGGTMLHMIRQIMGDEAFRGMLHGLNSSFYHQTVTTQQIESFISQYAKKDLSKIFDQYLRTAQIPSLEFKTDGKTGSYRWTNCVKGFNMPLRVYVGGQAAQWINPTEEWQTLPAGTNGELVASPDGQVVGERAAGFGGEGHRGGGGKGPGIEVVGVTGNGSAGDASLSVDRNFYITVRKVR